MSKNLNNRELTELWAQKKQLQDAENVAYKQTVKQW